jgi:hypothetical protein
MIPVRREQINSASLHAVDLLGEAVAYVRQQLAGDAPIGGRARKLWGRRRSSPQPRRQRCGA